MYSHPWYFNPRSPGGERLPWHIHRLARNHFNPRSPGGERPALTSPVVGVREFQSTLPGWGATFTVQVVDRATVISIHAPRVGSDGVRCSRRTPSPNFNPRSPGGERLGYGFAPCRIWGISIHAPRVGSDVTTVMPVPASVVFQSTLPGWGATRLGVTRNALGDDFNPRSPGGERLRKWTSSPTIWAKSSIFNTDCIADRR